MEPEKKDWPKKWTHTVNGDLITADLYVWTYDWEWGKVNKTDFERGIKRLKDVQREGHWELGSDDFWFRVDYPDGSSNIYNGERMTTQCPNCYGNFESCHKSGCGQRKPNDWTGWVVV